MTDSNRYSRVIIPANRSSIAQNGNDGSPLNSNRAKRTKPSAQKALGLEEMDPAFEDEEEANPFQL
jgi:hypothetical protein